MHHDEYIVPISGKFFSSQVYAGLCYGEEEHRKINYTLNRSDLDLAQLPTLEPESQLRFIQLELSPHLFQFARLPLARICMVDIRNPEVDDFQSAIPSATRSVAQNVCDRFQSDG